MADTKIPVFISFDYDHDASLKEFLVGQAKNDDSCESPLVVGIGVAGGSTT